MATAPAAPNASNDVLILPEARWGDQDPTRRQLSERAQRAGVRVAPRVEVQHVTAALDLAAAGIGNTLVTQALIDVLGYSERLASAPLEPGLFETFALIHRRNVRLSPATCELMGFAERHLVALQARDDGA